MMAAVAGQLREEWSPQQISGFMASLASVSVSHQWIYTMLVMQSYSRCGEAEWPASKAGRLLTTDYLRRCFWGMLRRPGYPTDMS